MQKIRLITNVGKSQMSSNKESFFLKKIPAALDEAVMNGLLYPKDENAAGMPSIEGKLVMLGHPKNSAGEFTTSNDPTAIANHYSGGDIEKHYNVNGVNFVDIKIKKSLLKAQTGGEWFYNRLEKRLPIGVSTGLLCERDMTEGVNNSGKKYFAVARNQRYDHLALLHESEAPAGGNDTFINFNADSTEIIVNLDAFIEANEDQGLFDKLVSKVLATLNFAHSEETRYNHTDDVNVTEELNTNEDNSMRKLMLAGLEAKGISVNAEITDADLLVKYNETNTAATPAANTDSKVLDAINALSKEIADMKKEKMTAEEEAKAKKAKALAGNSKIAALGLDEASLLTMNSATLDNLYAKNVGAITGNASAGFDTTESKEEVF